MIGVAGEVADGLIAHPTNSTPGYLRDVVRPGSRPRARARPAARPRAIRVIANPMTATGPDAAAVAAEREAARDVLAFTYSTPAYWATLEHHGWGEVGRALLAAHAARRSGSGMRELVSDAMLDALVPTRALRRDRRAAARALRGRGGRPHAAAAQGPGHDAAFARVIAALREN